MAQVLAIEMIFLWSGHHGHFLVLCPCLSVLSGVCPVNVRYVRFPSNYLESKHNHPNDQLSGRLSVFQHSA